MISVFGGYTCKKIANQLEVNLDSFIIFSICSDERIPEQLETYLNNIDKKHIPKHLIILGDFLRLPPTRDESPASYEAIRMIQIAAKSKGVLNVSWVSGNLERINESCENLQWFIFDFSQATYVESRTPSLINNSKSLNYKNKQAYQKLCRLLNFRIYISVEKKRITTISLTDNEAYQRGIARGLTADNEVLLWEILLEFTSLKKIIGSFNNLRHLPSLRKLNQLEELDLRGNLNIDLTEISTARSLKKLNISACGLREIPKSVQELKQLTSLLVYKNFISDLSLFQFPKGLKRLSLYRNQINNTELNLDYCTSLEEINLGANPISKMTFIISSTISSLKLRARYVKGSISVSSHGKTAVLVTDN